MPKPLLGSLLAAALLAAPVALHAQTSVNVNFDSINDLSLFTQPNTSPNTSTTSLGFSNANGAGSPLGSVVFQSSGALHQDKHDVAYYNGLSINANTATSFSMSIMMQFPDVSSTLGENDGEIRFGFFAADPATGLPNPGTAGSPSTFSTANPSIYVKAKFDVPSPGASPVISMEPQMTTAYNSTKSVAVPGTAKVKTTQFSLFDWYKFTLTMTLVSPGTYSGSAAIYDMGFDGTATPQLLNLDTTGTTLQSWTAATDSLFASSNAVYAGLAFGGETDYDWSGNQFHIYADNLNFSSTVPEPATAGLLLCGGLLGMMRRRRA